jgi:hypothetical protein
MRQKGKTCYYTQGYEDLVFYNGIVERSYRITSALYNRIVQQENALESRRLQEQVEREGLAYLNHLKVMSEQILEQSGYDKQGYALNPEVTTLLEQSQSPIIVEHLATVQSAFTLMVQQAPETVKPHLVLNHNAYEAMEQSVNISIDDICTKEQREIRRKKVEKVEKIEKIEKANLTVVPPKGTKEKVSKTQSKCALQYQTVIHIQSKAGQYVLNARNLSLLCPILIAFLLKNKCLTHNWVFFTDGQRTLIDNVIARFAFKGNYKLILDYYHLQKKCAKQFYSALHKNERRDVYEKQLKDYLWYGLTHKAIEYLKSIDSKDIKNQQELDILIAYIVRNINYIPCYALRKKIGLRNSSNRVEKANDQLVAQRQKHNGMSWSSEGSIALAELTAIKCNKEQNLWMAHRKISFLWAA